MNKLLFLLLTISLTVFSQEENDSQFYFHSDTLSIGQNYSYQFKYIIHNKNITFSASGLPDGLSIDESGTIYGNPIETGEFNVLITISDGDTESENIIRLVVKNNYSSKKKIKDNIEVFPNPFDFYLKIRYFLDNQYGVDIKLFNKTGDIVKNFVDNSLEPDGVKEIYWDCIDESDKQIKDGWYMLQFNFYDIKGNLLFSEERKILRKSKRF